MPMSTTTMMSILIMLNMITNNYRCRTTMAVQQTSTVTLARSMRSGEGSARWASPKSPNITTDHKNFTTYHQISPKISIDSAKTEASNSTHPAHNKTVQPYLVHHRAPMAWSGKPRTGNLPQLWLWRRSLMPFATELTLNARSGSISCFWSTLEKIIITGKSSFWKSLGATQTSSSCWTCTGRPTTRTSTSSSSSWRPTSTTWSRRATSSRASTDSTSCTSCSRWIFSQFFCLQVRLLPHSRHAQATQFLHSGNVIHRDQKPSNILLDSQVTKSWRIVDG